MAIKIAKDHPIIKVLISLDFLKEKLTSNTKMSKIIKTNLYLGRVGIAYIEDFKHLTKLNKKTKNKSKILNC